MSTLKTRLIEQLIFGLLQAASEYGGGNRRRSSIINFLTMLPNLPDDFLVRVAADDADTWDSVSRVSHDLKLRYGAQVEVLSCEIATCQRYSECFLANALILSEAEKKKTNLAGLTLIDVDISYVSPVSPVPYNYIIGTCVLGD